MTALRIPDSWGEMSAEWMTAALAGRFPGAEVAAVTLEWASDGTNRRARFGLRYRAGAGPGVVFVKAEGAHREVHARNGNLFNEPRIYASGVPLPVDHPEPYGVVIDEAALDWMVVMEDVALRGGDPRDSTRPLSTSQVANGVRDLARLHRAYWGFSGATHPALAWVQTWAPTEGFHSALRRRIPLAMERAGGRLPAEVARLSADEIVDFWVRYVALLDRDPTLLHADAHIGNVYLLPDDDVGFLDWQVVRRGHWSQDVGYFLQGALTHADRRAAERELIASYAGELGRGVSPADAWQWYRGSPAYGLAIWLSTLGTDGYQPQDVSLELAVRYAAAFVELQTPGALTALEAGELEMATSAEAIACYRDVVTAWAAGDLGVVMPGATSGHEFLDRFDAAVRSAAAAGATVAAVSHGGANTAAGPAAARRRARAARSTRLLR